MEARTKAKIAEYESDDLNEEKETRSRRKRKAFTTSSDSESGEGFSIIPNPPAQKKVNSSQIANGIN